MTCSARFAPGENAYDVPASRLSAEDGLVRLPGAGARQEATPLLGNGPAERLALRLYLIGNTIGGRAHDADADLRSGRGVAKRAAALRSAALRSIVPRGVAVRRSLMF